MTVLTKELVLGIRRESDLQEQVIVPLLRAMGFRDVTSWHGGPNEVGKDVVAWREGMLGSRDFYAVVAKVGRIPGVRNVGVVATQINQAFGATIPEPLRGDDQTRIRIHSCWVVTNGAVSNDGRH